MERFDPEHDKTLHGLMCWSNKLIEKLGCMLLQKHNEPSDILTNKSIEVYKLHIDKIIKDLKSKLRHLTEKDTQHEVEIILVRMSHFKHIIDAVLILDIPRGEISTNGYSGEYETNGLTRMDMESKGGAKVKKTSKTAKKTSKKSSKKSKSMNW